MVLNSSKKNLRPTSNAHEFEAVALESELGNPAATKSISLIKSKTSMGFSDRRGYKRTAALGGASPLKNVTKLGDLSILNTDYADDINESRVDQKR